MSETQAMIPDTSDWEEQIHVDLAKESFYKDETEFTADCKKLDKDAQEILLRKMRLDRNFYKNIMDEKFREKHPHSYRYIDAKIRIELLNRNGKILNTLINE